MAENSALYSCSLTRKAALRGFLVAVLTASSSVARRGTAAESSAPAQLSEELALDADAGMMLRKTFEMIDKGAIRDAEPRLTGSLADYKARQAPPEQMAVLYKYR